MAADLAAYQRAFVAMDSDPAQLLVVAETGQDVVATMQLSVIPGLARRGALRAPIEAVRVSEAYRSGGLGAAMISWAIDEARRQGCGLGPADHRQIPDQRAPLLRTARLRLLARRDETRPLTARQPGRTLTTARPAPTMALPGRPA